ncbi:MAG: NAD(P)-dependent oxidoreductase [Roseibium sp.]
MSKILITPRSLSKGGHPALEPLVSAGFELAMPAPGQTPTENQLMEALPGCVGWLAGVEPVSPAVIEMAADLRVISRNGTGVDNLPLDVLEGRGIALKRAEGANARGVAELALALALAGLRRIVSTHDGMRQGNWPREIGTEILGSQTGVIGLGAIGSAFAEFCLGLGAKVHGYDPMAPKNRVSHPNFTRASFSETLTDAVILSLHAPMPEVGKPLIGTDEIDLMSTGAIVVNTARAGLVDETAMLAALEDGRIGCYATDVFHTEPPEETPLLKHPNVITTTHIGGFTGASVTRATQSAVDNLLSILDDHAD